MHAARLRIIGGVFAGVRHQNLNGAPAVLVKGCTMFQKPHWHSISQHFSLPVSRPQSLKGFLMSSTMFCDEQ